MARRKSRRGLGFTPDVHASFVGSEEVGATTDAFKRAAKWAREHHCGSALNELLEANNMRGELDAHLKSSGDSHFKKPWVGYSTRMEKAMDKARASFAKACVAPRSKR